jgi:eukaryotic-like serine/threonine-protein kinase
VAGERSRENPATGGRNRVRWHFAGAVLDERSFELSINGDTIDIERKPLEVLMYLLQHAGEVCTKDELLAGVWPGRVLSETVLTKCVGRLREALSDADQLIIKTAYGFGYRLVAPVRIETEAAREPSRFDFRPGDHPPGRPLWSLVDRLGLGGHGEAWRGRHDKTGEFRVFKFALDEASLAALKREITLFRVINDTVGAGARVVRLLDWNLEQAPCFLEAEYISGGSLIDWARTRGGLPAIALAERLELVARLAEALAAVHSVGVLHKDLKPSNVLVGSGEGGTDALLADFGSGSVLDVAELERLGITRLGFTKTLAVNTGYGTPMYLAPEIIAGQPFTVKSDIYALGVILYQAVVGDFSRLMSPGWEREVADDLLCQDIAQLAEGNPAMRLGDAGHIARALRSLEERRVQLLKAREAQAEADRARQLLDRARARRTGIRIAFVAMAAGLIASTVLMLRERDANTRSVEAANHSKSVTEFLSQDVFEPVSSGMESVKELPVSQLLLRAGRQIDIRFADQPAVAAELHFIIGRSLGEFYETGAAEAHFNRALDLARGLQGEGSTSALRSAAELIEYDYSLGKLAANMPRYESTLAAGRKALPADADAVLQLRQQVARGHSMLGRWQSAAAEIKALLDDLTASAQVDIRRVGRASYLYGDVLVALARPAEGARYLRAAIDDLGKALKDTHPEVADARNALGRALTATGHYDDARRQLRKADDLATAWEPEGTWRRLRPQLLMAFLEIEMDQPEGAKKEFQKIIQIQEDPATGGTPELDHTGFVRQAYGDALLREQRATEARLVLEKAVSASEKADGHDHPLSWSIRLSYAEALLADAKGSASLPAVRSIVDEPPPDLPSPHPFLVQHDRLRGLLALRLADPEMARASLQRALDGAVALYGAEHWRTKRLRSELAPVSP